MAFGRFEGKEVMKAGDIEGLNIERPISGYMPAAMTNRIANQIGMYWYVVAVKTMFLYGLSVAQADQLIGMVTGKPNRSLFYRIDRMGIDSFLAAIEETVRGIADAGEKREFELPNVIFELVDKGWLGQKNGQGFYKKLLSPSGVQTLCWDYHTGCYKSADAEFFPLPEAAYKAGTLTDRLQLLVYGPELHNEFIWEVIKRWLLYAANTVAAIGDDYKLIDKAIQAEFCLAHGPFALWDCIGLKRSIERIRQEGGLVPEWVEKRQAFYDEPDSI